MIPYLEKQKSINEVVNTLMERPPEEISRELSLSSLPSQIEAFNIVYLFTSYLLNQGVAPKELIEKRQLVDYYHKYKKNGVTIRDTLPSALKYMRYYCLTGKKPIVPKKYFVLPDKTDLDRVFNYKAITNKRRKNIVNLVEEKEKKDEMHKETKPKQQRREKTKEIKPKKRKRYTPYWVLMPSKQYQLLEEAVTAYFQNKPDSAQVSSVLVKELPSFLSAPLSPEYIEENLSLVVERLGYSLLF